MAILACFGHLPVKTLGNGPKTRFLALFGRFGCFGCFGHTGQVPGGLRPDLDPVFGPFGHLAHMAKRGQKGVQKGVKNGPK